MLLTHGAVSTQEYTDIYGLECLAKQEKPCKEILGITVRPSTKMKTSTSVNQVKKQNYLAIELCSVYLESRTNETHQQIALFIHWAVKC